MRLAVIGSRGANVEDLGKYLPPGVTEIVSGGARGIDRCAQAYAQENGIQVLVVPVCGAGGSSK